MGHVFHQLYYHVVWATRAREPHLHRSYRTDFLTTLDEEVRKRGGVPIRHNSMPDHVHLLVRLPPTIAVSEFIGKLKGATAYRVNDEIQPKFKLKWQEGYGVLTLRKDELDRVSRYIDNQESHHAGKRLSDILERIVTDQDDWASDAAARPLNAR
jgi:REP element-mobilizing transposase RayT